MTSKSLIKNLGFTGLGDFLHFWLVVTPAVCLVLLSFAIYEGLIKTRNFFLDKLPRP